MTEVMTEAGISAYVEHRDAEPEQLVHAIWTAMKDAKQKEALEKYWELYRNE